MKEINQLKHCKDCTKHFIEPIIINGKAVCARCGSLNWKPMITEKVV